jgi:DNA-directed RNA polymerase alpha subunit
LPVAPEPSALSEADFESAFADLDLEESDIDVSAFTGMTFDPNAELGAPAEAVEIEEIEMSAAEELSALTLTDIGVSTRWVNKFAEAGIETVADLRGRSEDDLLNLPGVGQKAVEELKEGLEANGLSVLV